MSSNICVYNVFMVFAFATTQPVLASTSSNLTKCARECNALKHAGCEKNGKSGRYECQCAALYAGPKCDTILSLCERANIVINKEMRDKRIGLLDCDGASLMGGIPPKHIPQFYIKKVIPEIQKRMHTIIHHPMKCWSNSLYLYREDSPRGTVPSGCDFLLQQIGAKSNSFVMDHSPTSESGRSYVKRLGRIPPVAPSEWYPRSLAYAKLFNTTHLLTKVEYSDPGGKWFARGWVDGTHLNRLVKSKARELVCSPRKTFRMVQDLLQGIGNFHCAGYLFGDLWERRVKMMESGELRLVSSFQNVTRLIQSDYRVGAKYDHDYDHEKEKLKTIMRRVLELNECYRRKKSIRAVRPTENEDETESPTDSPGSCLLNENIDCFLSKLDDEYLDRAKDGRPKYCKILEEKHLIVEELFSCPAKSGSPKWAKILAIEDDHNAMCVGSSESMRKFMVVAEVVLITIAVVLLIILFFREVLRRRKDTASTMDPSDLFMPQSIPRSAAAAFFAKHWPLSEQGSGAGNENESRRQGKGSSLNTLPLDKSSRKAESRAERPPSFPHYSHTTTVSALGSPRPPGSTRDSPPVFSRTNTPETWLRDPERDTAQFTPPEEAGK